MVARVQKPYHLLVADDDAAFRETVRSIFEPRFELIEAESGEEAIEIVEATPVHLALLDMHMRVLTGLETLRILKTLNAVAPCILITADATEQLERAATQAQAYSVLRKPVRKAELVGTVSTALADAYADPDVASWLAG
jgi:CheY-like chemotaxis protein